MIFDKLRLTSGKAGGYTPLNLDFPILGSQPSDSYLLKAIEGLGPPDIDNSIVQTTALGGVYQGRQAQARQLVVRIGLRPNYSAGETVQGLREVLYGTMQQLDDNPMRIYLILNDGTSVASTEGYVSKFETSIFTKTPEVQITIDCLNPYFAGPSQNLAVYAPYGANNPTYFAFDVPGSAETQFVYGITITANQTIPLRLYNYFTSDNFTLNQNFQKGDQIVVDNSPGYRRITLTRAGTQSSLLPMLTYNSVWYNLRPGQNIITTSTANMTFDTVRVTPKYWGV